MDGYPCPKCVEAAAKGVVVLPSALAGLTDALSGESGAIRIELGAHEIMDLALSGQAYSRDGRYNFRLSDDYLVRLWKMAKGEDDKP